VNESESADWSAAVGEPAPDITLPKVGGGDWSLSEHRGRPVLLIFHRHLA